MSASLQSGFARRRCHPVTMICQTAARPPVTLSAMVRAAEGQVCGQKSNAVARRYAHHHRRGVWRKFSTALAPASPAPQHHHNKYKAVELIATVCSRFLHGCGECQYYTVCASASLQYVWPHSQQRKLQLTDISLTDSELTMTAVLCLIFSSLPKSDSDQYGER